MEGPAHLQEEVEELLSPLPMPWPLRVYGGASWDRIDFLTPEVALGLLQLAPGRWRIEAYCARCHAYGAVERKRHYLAAPVCPRCVERGSLTHQALKILVPHPLGPATEERARMAQDRARFVWSAWREELEVWLGRAGLDPLSATVRASTFMDIVSHIAEARRV